MSKIQPHNIVGPNNAGKMIIRGICFSSTCEQDEKFAKVIRDYLAARGTVSDIKLSEKSVSVTYTDEEKKFICDLIDQLKELEFSDSDLKNATKEQIEDQRDLQAGTARAEINKFIESQVEQGKETNLQVFASTIIGSVESRDVATYADTLKWEDSIVSVSLFNKGQSNVQQTQASNIPKEESKEEKPGHVPKLS